MQYGNTYRPAYPGYPVQGYRIGDHAYSTGGSEAQKAPSSTTDSKMPYQWRTEHKNEVSFSLTGQGLSMTDRASSRATNASTAAAAGISNERSTVAIGIKMAATDSLKGELSAEAASVAAEMALLKECMGATQVAIASKTQPLAAVAAWYAKRGTRYTTERLSDPVKHDLEVMTATLKESVRLLESALSAQQSEHMRLSVKAEALDADIADKAACLAIDTNAKAIAVDYRPQTAPAPSMSSRMSHPMGMSVLHAPYDPKMWQISSKTICDEARKVMQVSKRLRDTSYTLVEKREAAELEVYGDLTRDYANSIAAIKQVIGATEEQIAACSAEMGQIDDQFAACEAGFAAKQSALGVANDRLSMRATRPARELVQDPAQRALGNELAQLKLASRLIEGNAGKLANDKGKLGSTVGVLIETVELKKHFLDIEYAPPSNHPVATWRARNPIRWCHVACPTRPLPLVPHVVHPPRLPTLLPRVRYAGEECMATLKSLVQPSVAKLPTTTAFHSSLARPVTALPANRLSVSRSYATR